MSSKQRHKAERLYSGFMGRSPSRFLKVTVPAPPKMGIAIGKVEAIIYESDRNGSANFYRHDFRSSSRPLLVASHDGRRLYLIGGSYSFTSRGIVDRRSKNRRPG